MRKNNPDSLDNIIEQLHSISAKYKVHPKMIYDLADTQNIKHNIRDGTTSMSYCLNIVDRYYKIYQKNVGEELWPTKK